ncbi:FixH family protein [Yoonia vestfoldensis]|jgi:nitrogen fixation protein FixH|uniref:FixH n=1 Tax=Yoonia vestfoldensis TaxID=245188 RepID=A0A1Y0E8V4_9RHOB|nr:FixH family protein [Yoonia vestfoldensis]ART99982.1 FixH [Yoonia vestfoldensis]
MTADIQKPREFTGKHMLAVMVGGFGIIITVNFGMAYMAVSTFPGVEARSTYVASQTFEVNRTAQDALGWDVVATLDDGLLTLAIHDADGAPVQPKVRKAIFGRATHTGEDHTPDFAWNGTALAAMVPSRDGYWNLRLELESADGTIFRRRIQLRDR